MRFLPYQAYWQRRTLIENAWAKIAFELVTEDAMAHYFGLAEFIERFDS